MEKVKILLSTYNGEKYIEEQLNSLYNQSYNNIEILVRDDGSTDKTRMILKKHQEKGKIRLLLGENIGYWKSFFALLADETEADYYAFCDQDDIWHPEKITRGVCALSDGERDSIKLYFGSFDYYDANMEYMREGLRYYKTATFANSLFECLPLGCNCLINEMAKKILIKNEVTVCRSHDWWTFMVCAGLGDVYYDNEVSMKYRRHGNNASATGDSFLKLLRFRLKTFFFEDYFKVIRGQIEEYKLFFYEEISIENQKLLDLITEKSLKSKVKLIFFPNHFRQRLLDDVIIRLLILLGKL